MTLTKDIIAKLDIEEVVLEFYPAEKLTGKISNGWIKVHALGREDRDPSANINLETGYYKDFGSVGQSAGLFDWLSHTGAFADWKDARKAMAKKAGIKVPRTKAQEKADRDERWYDLIQYTRLPIGKNPLGVRGFLKSKPGVSIAAIEAFGGRRAEYKNNLYHDPDSTQDRINDVIVIPIFNVTVSRPDLAPLFGVCLYPCNGKLIYLHKNDTRKQINQGKSGLIGKCGLEILMHPEKRVKIVTVIKTEGPSCAMALWDAMTPEDREIYPIVTNSSGAGETVLLPYWADLLKGLSVVVIHDGDTAGQAGAKNWQKELGSSCSEFRNIELYEDVVEKGGPDLRDWLNVGGGGMWTELKAMITTTEPLEVSEDQSLKDVTEDERLLHQIGCIVIGDLGDFHHRVQIYSNYLRDYRNIVPGTLTELKCIQFFGKSVGELMQMGTINRDKIRSAIASKAAECGRVNSLNRIGPGIWCNADKDALAIVGEQGLFIYDDAGELALQKDPRFDGRAAMLRMDDFTEPWFDEGKLVKYVRMAHNDQEWSIDVMFKLNNIFERWDNLMYGSDDAFLLAGLLTATILENIWEIRPQVWISGPTDSGKSHMTRVMQWMFGPLMCRMDAPSEAGFRNAIQNRNLICSIDEFEKSQHRKKIIETLRSTTKGGTQMKATSDHKSVAFFIRHLIWFTGTNRGYQEFAADANRVINIDLKAPTSEQYTKGQSFPPSSELRDLGHKVIAVAIAHWKKMLEMEAALSRLSISGIAHRLIECYAVPVAVHASVMGCDVDRAKIMLQEMLETRSDDVSVSPQADDEGVLRFILRQTILIGRVNWSLGALAQCDFMIEGLPGMKRGKDEAGRYGVRMVRNGDWCFDEKAIQESKWWRDSDHRKFGITESLKRLIAAALTEVEMTKQFKDHPFKCSQAMQGSRYGVGKVFTARVPKSVMEKFIGEEQIETGFDEKVQDAAQKLIPYGK